MGTIIKPEEEVQEYLKKIYIEYRFGCESEKKPEVCHLLGDYEVTVTRNFDNAAAIYKENCDERHHLKSCAKYGSLAAMGRGCKADINVAYDYLKKGCEGGEGNACLQAGIMCVSDTKLSEKDRVTQLTKGIEMLKKSCWEHGIGSGCYYLSGVYIRGIPEVLEPNLPEAYKASMKACESGNPYACANVSQMYERGEGIDKNPKLADSFKKRAMELQGNITKARKHLGFLHGVDK